MKHLLTIFLLFILNTSSFAQSYKYKYYLDKDLGSVDSASAAFIGKGLKDSSLFLLDCFDKSTGSLLMSAHFTDSSLAVLEGEYKSYHINRQWSQTGSYTNNAEQGIWVNRDTAGMITDSIEFHKGQKLSSRIYHYYESGKIRSYSVVNGSGLQQLFLAYDTSGNIFKDNSGEDMVFTKTEIEAEYPGGQAAWADFLRKNLRMPDLSKYDIPTGTYTAIVRFIVNKEGNVSDIAAETNVGYGMEQEVIRLIRFSKNWKPAMQNGRMVKAYRRQPVTFMIDNGDRDYKRN